MEDNLLFANNRKEFIQEFLAEMERMECGFQIDTASSGLEAAKLLKKKRYKVVVTGMNLSTFGGAKLIAYLNQHSPQTTCIVYTRRMEPAYLKLLVNELKVFRIFQKPADYGKLYDSIQEGFALYEQEDEAIRQRKEMDLAIRQASLKIAELEQVSKERASEKMDFLCFMRGVLKAFQEDIHADLEEGERKRLLQFEGEALQWVLQEQGKEMGEIRQAMQELAKEFHHPKDGQEMEVQVEGGAGQADSEALLGLRFMVWIVMKSLFARFPAYQVKLLVACGGDGHFQAEIEGSFPDGAWEQRSREGAGREISDVAHKVVGNVARRFSHTSQGGGVVYRMEV